MRKSTNEMDLDTITNPVTDREEIYGGPMTLDSEAYVHQKSPKF